LLTRQAHLLLWQTGLGLDFGELFEKTTRGFLAKLGAQYYWGPLRFTEATSTRLAKPSKNLRFDTTAASQYPIGSGAIKSAG